MYPNAAVIAGSFENGLGHWREFAASRSDREADDNARHLVCLGSRVRNDRRPAGVSVGKIRVPRSPNPACSRDASAALPPLVGVIAFLFLYGESGLVTRGIQRTLGLQEAPWRLTGVWAIIFVHAYTMYVYVFLFVSAGLERFDTTLEEAAAGLGASSSQRLRRVTLPLLMRPLPARCCSSS